MFTSGDGTLSKTAAAGTRIQVPLGGAHRRITYFGSLSYSTGPFPHVITIMRGASRDTVVAALNAGDTLVTSRTKLTDGDGNDIAVGDTIAVRMDDFRWHVSLVSSLDTPKTGITITTAIPTGRNVLRDAPIVAYGAATDSMHADFRRTALANQENLFGDGMFCKSFWPTEPLVIDSDNVGIAGTLNYSTCAYCVAE